ncbi:MAG: 4Fe-4S binding protein [Candidatus Bathyarchaeia archaeon]|jgi:ferredoxin
MRRRKKLRRGLRHIITHYGYSNGSGDYYITIDTDKCNGCGKCVKQCPQSALQLETMLIDLEDKTVASVTEEHRKKIKYTCSSCKPETNKAPCVLACESKAINCTWNPH